MDSFTGYTKPLATAHAAVQDLLGTSQQLLYQEKIDGSQISFGVSPDGSLFIRSRGRVFNIEAPDGMFTQAAASVKERAGLLVPGWTYRGEYLRKPKHNVLAYERVPEGNVAIFDIATGLHDYIADHEIVAAEARRCGFSYAQVFDVGPFEVATLDSLLERTSMLGGARIEGVVLKDHYGAYFGRDGKPVMAKYVSEFFKETSKAVFKSNKPNSTHEITRKVAAAVCTEARWSKAVQHLREAGSLVNAPQDIGVLLKELHQDIEAEATDLAKDLLWDMFRNSVLRQSSRGFAEWYKGRLMDGVV